MRLALFLLLLPSTSSAQINKPALILQAESAKNSDSLRYAAYQELCMQVYAESQPDSAIFFAQKHYRLALKKKNTEEQNRAQYNEIEIRYKRKEYETLIPVLEEKAENKQIPAHWKHKFLSQLAYCYAKTKKIDKADQALSIAVNQAIEARDYTAAGKYTKRKAGILYFLNNKEKAIDTYKNAIHFFDQANNTAASIETKILIGVTYEELGKFNQAEQLMLEATAQAEKEPANKVLETAYYTLSQYYLNRSDFPASYHYTVLARKTMERNGNVYGVANCDLQIGTLYYFRNNFVKALEYYQKSLAQYSALSETQGVSRSKNNIAISFLEIGKFTEAEKELLELIAIAEKGKDTVALGQAWHNLGKSKMDQFTLMLSKHPSGQTNALLQSAKENFTKAAFFFNRANEAGGLASAYRNLANVFLALQENQQASDYLQQSILSLGKRNDIQAQRFTLRTEISLAMRAGNETEALKKMDSLIALVRKSCDINFPILSEKEKGEYLEIYRSEVNNYANLSLELQSTHPEMAGKLFNLVLNTKGFLLRAGNQIRTIAQNSGDEELEKIYREWITTTEALAASAASGEDGKLLREKAEELERKMSEKSSAIRDLYTWENTQWQDIKARLQKDEVAIEFTALTRSNAKEFDPQQKEMLLALIIRKDLEQPLMIEIKGMEQMEEAILKAGSSNAQALDQLYALQDWKNNPIRKHLWLPLEMHLKKCKRIYISPDGILHRIALSAVPVSSKKRICDVMEIRMVNSTANLLSDNNYRLQNNEKAMLFGGIDFNSADSISKTWDYLPGTKQEVEAIAGLFQKHKLSYILQQGKNASEEFLKKEATQATILHLSTHGYFFPSPQDAAKQQRKKTETDSNLVFRSKRDGFGMWQFVYSDDPMMRSGLALAGANQVWEKNILAQKEDGVFTALEASAMDLRNTKLLVLSACETGLGDVNATEGVYGLQRAFKMAGVKFMIISLWQVPDKETKIFMETFYGYFLSGIEIHTAFRKTQLDMSKLYSPYQWAAFELVE